MKAWDVLERNPLVPRIERALSTARGWALSVGTGILLFLAVLYLLGATHL